MALFIEFILLKRESLAGAIMLIAPEYLVQAASLNQPKLAYYHYGFNNTALQVLL